MTSRDKSQNKSPARQLAMLSEFGKQVVRILLKPSPWTKDMKPERYRVGRTRVGRSEAMIGKCSSEKFHESDEERQPRGEKGPKEAVHAGTHMCQSMVTVSVLNYCRVNLI